MVWSVRMLLKREVNTEVEKDLLKVWEENIDDGLRASAAGSFDENFSYTWNIPVSAPKDTLLELITRYRQAGWRVEVMGTAPNRFLEFEPNGGWKAHLQEYNSL